jgi:hypothetical protein
LPSGSSQSKARRPPSLGYIDGERRAVSAADLAFGPLANRTRRRREIFGTDRAFLPAHDCFGLNPSAGRLAAAHGRPVADLRLGRTQDDRGGATALGRRNEIIATSAPHNHSRNFSSAHQGKLRLRRSRSNRARMVTSASKALIRRATGDFPQPAYAPVRFEPAGGLECSSK